MERWTSEPLPFDPSEAYARVDLEFEGVEHDSSTFTALAYLNNRDVPDDAGRDDEQGFAGGFTVFGHGACWGQLGHCDPGRDPVSEFDARPEHPLTPVNMTLEITEAVRRLGSPESIEVTLLVASEDEDEEQLLRFDQLTLVVYEP
jgi:tyrosinase